LEAVRNRAKEIPNLISPHLGDRVSASWTAASALSAAPASGDRSSAGDKPGANAIVALPLGGRVKVDPWNDQLHLLKSTPVGTVAEGENTPLQITPFMLYLTRVENSHSAPAAISADAAAQMDAPPKSQTRKKRGLVCRARTRRKSPEAFRVENAAADVERRSTSY
jgi:hypothetical protein